MKNKYIGLPELFERLIKILTYETHEKEAKLYEEYSLKLILYPDLMREDLIREEITKTTNSLLDLFPFFKSCIEYLFDPDAEINNRPPLHDYGLIFRNLIFDMKPQISEKYYNYEFELQNIENYNTLKGELPYFEEITSIASLATHLEYLKYFINQKPDITNFSKTNPPKGFRSEFSESAIYSLYNMMINNYISSSTEYYYFQAIFKDNNLPINFKKIKWIKAKNLLAYFVVNVFIKTEKHYWAKAENCFENAEGLKYLQSEYYKNKSKKPKNADQIDNIIKILYPLHSKA